MDNSTSSDSDTVARPKRFWTYTRRTLLAVFCLFALAAGALLSNYSQRSATLKAIVDDVLHDPLHPLSTWTPARQFTAVQQHTVNVLVLGCDSDYEETRPVAIKGTNGRSDAMLLAHFNFDNNTVKVLSIPRDTAVYIPRYRGLHKINAANAFGGPDLAVETVKSVFGVQPDYYVRLNFDGFQQLVDKLGGVDLTVHKQLDYDDNWGNLHVHLKPGYQHLDGYRAMGYVRIRHSDNDFERQKRQQEFLLALKERVKDPMTLIRLPEIVNTVTDNLKYSMTLEQLLTLVNFAHGLPQGSIQLSTLPADEGRSFVYARVAESEKLIRDMFTDGSGINPIIHAPERKDIAMSLRGRTFNGRRRHPRRSGLEGGTPKDDSNSLLVPSTEDIPLPDGLSAPPGDRTEPPTQDSAPGTGSLDTNKPAGDTSGARAGDGTTKQDTTPRKDAPDKKDGSDTNPKKDTSPPKGAGDPKGNLGGMQIG